MIELEKRFKLCRIAKSEPAKSLFEISMIELDGQAMK
jgi:hypothetical protein